MDYVFLQSCSVRDWVKPDLWSQYLQRIELLLSEPLYRLDSKDPLRRKVGKEHYSESGKFITDLSGVENRNQKYFFGDFKGGKAGFTIKICSSVETYFNSITWHFSKQMIDSYDGFEKIFKVFELGNEFLTAFYSFADLATFVGAKKRPQKTVNIQEELIGIFWLTFFNNHYIQFLGKEKFQPLNCEKFDSSYGLTLKLARCPAEIDEQKRSKLERDINAKSFVDISDFSYKVPGQYALTIDALKRGMYVK